MILRGVIESTFGGALCIRGFARIGDLAKISTSKTYQRELDRDRANGILKFLQEGTFRFFPELIFGLQLDNSNAIVNILGGVNSIISSGIKFESVKKDFTNYSNSDKLDSPILRRVSLDFLKEDEPSLSRIDGNHRLSAVDKYIGQNFFNSDTLSYYVPFCIILQLKSEEADKYENAYFHLINSKAKPLTTEENLKSILSSKYFSEIEIKQIIGDNGVLAKQLVDKLQYTVFSGINNIVNNRLREFCLDCINLISKINANISISRLQAIIHNIDVLYQDVEELHLNDSKGILLSFIYYKYKNNNEFKFFRQWIIKNYLHQISEISAESIIEIFDKIQQHKVITVFVAMPYWSHAKVSDYNKLFNEVLAEIQKKAQSNLTLELIPIMRNKGNSERIDVRLFNQIEKCDIFIADVTGCNINVLCEIAFAVGCKRPRVLIKEDEDPALLPFDIEKFQYIPYNREVYYNSIKGIIRNNLPEILRNEYLVHIQL